MIRQAVILAGLLLAGCSQEPGPIAVDSDEGGTNAAGGFEQPMKPGLYAVGDGTQVYSRTRLAADGTYTDLNDAMEPVGAGTWRESGPATICFDPEGDGENQEERCWKNGPADEDGSFLSVRVGGMEHYKVMPLEE